MKDTLNSRVKHREEFRPFAPTVAEEDQFETLNWQLHLIICYWPDC